MIRRATPDDRARILALLDLWEMSQDPAAPEALLAYLGQLARDRGGEFLTVVLNSRGPYYRSFRRMAFVPRHRRPMLAFGAPPAAAGARGWHVMLADPD